jgi:hypothetical protein
MGLDKWIYEVINVILNLKHKKLMYSSQFKILTM